MTWLSSKQTVYSYPSENDAKFEHMFHLILPLAVWVATILFVYKIVSQKKTHAFIEPFIIAHC